MNVVITANTNKNSLRKLAKVSKLVQGSSKNLDILKMQKPIGDINS